MATNTETVTLTRVCTKCKKAKTLTLSLLGFEGWQSGGQLIQVALPELSAADRELLITGICGPCFDELFGDDE